MSILVYNKVKEYRERLGYSCEDLAYLCDVTISTIRIIEAGFITPSIDLSLQLAYIFDSDLDNLFVLDIEEMILIDKRKEFIIKEFIKNENQSNRN